MQGPTHSSDSPVAHEFRIRARRMLRLGPVRVELRSNEQDFAGFRYFPQTVDLTAGDATNEGAADYTLSLCNLGIDGPWPLDEIRRVQDRTYRAKRFSAGYYLTDHFGAPSYLVTRGTHHWIFSQSFEPILWPYAVKLLLTLYSMHHGLLHLKAAAVAIENAATLLVAHGAGGKTVLLTHLCQNGAQFLSNTHTLVADGHALGIATSMRVRSDALFGPLIANLNSPPAVKAGEYIIDPVADLGWQGCTRAVLRNVVLVDYRGPEHHVLQAIDAEELFEYMDQFALALNVYGLKEDILDHLGADTGDFADQTRRMKAGLRKLLAQCRLFHASCDAGDPHDLRMIYDRLRRPHD
jgi:hypothetical protein